MKANAPLWIVSLGQGGGDAAAVGGPGAPTITKVGNIVTFTAGEEGAAGPTLGYGCEIEPEGPTLEMQAPDPSAGGTIVITDFTPYTDYVVSIYGVNAAGRGKAAQTDPFQINWNEATGGTVTDVDNYNGTTEKWRVHAFTDTGTFTVTEAPQDFRVLVVGSAGGGGSGADGSLGYGGGGGGGGGAVDSVVTLEPNDYTATVGAVGVTRTDISNQAYGGGGGASSLGSVVSAGGGGGGHSTWHASPNSKGGNSGGPQSHTGGTVGSSPGGAGASAGGNASGHSVGPGFASNITGTNVTSYGRGGGGGGSGWLHGNAGAKGTVIVAYRIGESSERDIDQAKAKQAAQAEGYERGLVDGAAEQQELIAASIAETADLPVNDDPEPSDPKKAMTEDKPKRTRKKAD